MYKTNTVIAKKYRALLVKESEFAKKSIEVFVEATNIKEALEEVAKHLYKEEKYTFAMLTGDHESSINDIFPHIKEISIFNDEEGK